jgi:hypothetical protein
MLHPVVASATFTDPALLAYRDSPEFKSYLAARKDWEVAAAALRNLPPTSPPCARRKMVDAWIAAQDEYRRLLAICRSLPIHKVAFGC